MMRPRALHPGVVRYDHEVGATNAQANLSRDGLRQGCGPHCIMGTAALAPASLQPPPGLLS